MDDPDIILLVGPHADRHPEQAAERLRPERIDLEHRRLHVPALRLGLVLEHRLADAETTMAATSNAPETYLRCWMSLIMRASLTARGCPAPFVTAIICERTGLVSAGAFRPG
jgi:hypothetical protein